MRCPYEGRRGDARTTTSLPASPLNSVSWSISSCAILRDGSDSASRTEHPGPARHPGLPQADIYLKIGKSSSSAQLKYCPVSFRSFSSLRFLLCFTSVEENCFDCIFLVDLSKQGHSPWCYDSTREDNSSGWVAALVAGSELLFRVTGVSLQTASQLSVLSFHREEQILWALFSFHVHTRGNRHVRSPR